MFGRNEINYPSIVLPDDITRRVHIGMKTRSLEKGQFGQVTEVRTAQRLNGGIRVAPFSCEPYAVNRRSGGETELLARSGLGAMRADINAMRNNGR